MDQILFPRFWNEKPALWFAQAESVFALSGVISDSDKFDYIVTELPPGAVHLVEDVILNPPQNEKYLRLKNEVIKQLSISYLEKEEIGNRRPSEYLQHLKNKADPRVPEETIRSLWLKSLPLNIREIVKIAAPGSTIEVLSEMADRIQYSGPVSQGNSGHNNENITECISKLNVLLENLSDQMEKLQQVFQCQHCSSCLRCKSLLDANNNKSSMQSPPELPTCRYHARFGEKAFRCLAPCVFKEKNATRELLNATSF